MFNVLVRGCEPALTKFSSIFFVLLNYGEKIYYFFF